MAGVMSASFAVAVRRMQRGVPAGLFSAGDAALAFGPSQPTMAWTD